MELSTIMDVIQTASILLGLVVAYGTIRRRHADDGAELAVMKKDIEYIKARVDDIGGMRDRLTAAEASTSQAHKRIDRIEGEIARSDR